MTPRQRPRISGIGVLLFALGVLGVLLVLFRLGALVACLRAYPWFVCL